MPSLQRVVVCAFLTLPLLAQDQAGTAGGGGSPPGKHWYNFPIPLVPTSSLPPPTPTTPIEPRTRTEKLKDAVQRTIGPQALASRALLAGWNQRNNNPQEWGQGWEAYGKRYGYRMTRLATRNAIMLGFDVAMGTDQRYERCDCSGFFPRMLHAWRRVFVARTDSGGETVNLARIAGAYGSHAITYRLVLPERYQTAGHVMRTGTEYLGWRMLGDTIREFWPEIHRAIRVGPPPGGRD